MAANYWEDSQYDTPGNRHYANAMQNINPEGCYRVAFIDGNGGWRRSELYCSSGASVIEPNYNAYAKKAFCKNISTLTYTAKCTAWRVHE